MVRGRRYLHVVGLLLCWFVVQVASSAHADAAQVMRITLPQLRPELRPAADRLYRALMRQAHYLLTTVHPWDKDPTLKLLTESKSAEHWIRPNTSTLVGLAVLRRWGPYDANIVGVSRQELLTEYIIPMMRYLVVTHRTGDRPTSDGKRWGNAWQSAHWAYALGRAAWFIWDDLPPDVQAGIRRVVAYEAARFVDKTPPHGMYGDTKAEENAWNSRIFSAAIVLMPDHPQRPRWEEAFKRWAISAFMRPADATCQQVIDGRKVADWFVGPCIFDDFTCENHGFVHPGYMGCIGLTLSCHLDFRLTGREAPKAISWNAAQVYENLKWMATPDGGYIYPSGQDWTLFRNPQKAHLHLLMAAFEGDPDGWSLANRCWDAMEKMQTRSADGRIFLPGEYFFPSTQHDTLAMIGLQWLYLHVADPIRDEPQQRLGTRHLPYRRIVLQRTRDAFITLSYGSRVMAQIAAMRLDRIVSPEDRSLVGAVFLSGQEKPERIVLRDSHINVRPDSFTAKLVIDHGKAVRAHLYLQTDSNGTLYIEEELRPLHEAKLQRIATGLIGILNNRQWVYEKGYRIVELDSKAHKVQAESGNRLSGQVFRITIDETLQISSDTPLTILYAGARGPTRGRATDHLYLNYIEDPPKYAADQFVSHYRAKIRIVGD